MTRMSPATITSDSIYAQLTPAGRGAVATVLVSSPNLSAEMPNLFRTASGIDLGKCLSEQDIIYGNWIGEGQFGEDLILCPRSEVTAEIHCHGGVTAVSTVIRTLEARGFRPATDREIDELLGNSPWVSDACRALTSSPTERTSLILLEYLQTIDDQIDQLASQIKTKPLLARERINNILQLSEFGRHLSQPWSVVLCGEPNVGKSSLINAIVGFERAIVHATPGTTRDIVTEQNAFDGWPVELKDTAGLRLSQDQIEEQGISKALREIQNADLVLLVFDATQSRRIAEQFEPHRNHQLVVVNKSDLVANHQPVGDEVWTSAKTGLGIEELVNEIGRRLVPNPPTERIFPLNLGQVKAFERVLELIAADQIDAAVDSLRSKTY